MLVSESGSNDIRGMIIWKIHHVILHTSKGDCYHIMSCMSRFIAYNLDNGNIQDRKPIYSIPIRLLQIYCLIKRIWTINFQLYNIRHPEFVFVRLKSFKWQDNKILCISIEYSRRVLYILFLFFLFRKRCYFILYVFFSSVFLDKCTKLSLSRFSISR